MTRLECAQAVAAEFVKIYLLCAYRFVLPCPRLNVPLVNAPPICRRDDNGVRGVRPVSVALRGAMPGRQPRCRCLGDRGHRVFGGRRPLVLQGGI